MAKRCLRTIAKEEATKKILQSGEVLPGARNQYPCPGPAGASRLVGSKPPSQIPPSPAPLWDDVTFVKRQFCSGTRILLDAILKEQAVDKRALHGYEREEATHAAVGILVKEYVADVGVATCTCAVAKFFSSDFTPSAEEEYDLQVTKAFMADECVTTLVGAINLKEFAERLNAFDG